MGIIKPKQTGTPAGVQNKRVSPTHDRIKSTSQINIINQSRP
jgi:hypothetical protein